MAYVSSTLPLWRKSLGMSGVLPMHSRESFQADSSAAASFSAYTSRGFRLRAAS